MQFLVLSPRRRWLRHQDPSLRRDVDADWLLRASHNLSASSASLTPTVLTAAGTGAGGARAARAAATAVAIRWSMSAVAASAILGGMC